MFTCKNANCYLESPVRRTVHQTTSAFVGRICWICAICRWMRNMQIFECPRIAQRNRAQSAYCADPATAPNTYMSAKHSHILFILSRGDMVKHEVGVCVCVSPIMLRITLEIRWTPCILHVLDQCLKTYDCY